MVSDNDQEMATNPGVIDQTDGVEQGTFLERLGADTETKMEDFFQWWGHAMAARPWLVLFCGEYFLYLHLDIQRSSLTHLAGDLTYKRVTSFI